MIALNSCNTPKEVVSAEVIYIEDIKNINKTDVKGKIVFAETSPYQIYKAANTAKTIITDLENQSLKD